MGDSEEIEGLRFPIDESMYMTRYAVTEDEDMIHGFKWMNLGVEEE
jgi:hypothetical protein